MGSKPDKSQEYALAAKKAHSILGCLSKNVTSKSRGVIHNLSSALARPFLEYTHFWSALSRISAPQWRKDIDILE